MSRAQTSGKRDREMKKRDQKKVKALKKEERKANSAKGKGLDDMIAYVDENGRITSTPPDPLKKRFVNAEEIEIGVPRQKPPDPADLIRTGTVTFFNESKGYGFIKDINTGESVFVHVNGLQTEVKENDRVAFEVERGNRGLVAVKVRLVTA